MIWGWPCWRIKQSVISWSFLVFTPNASAGSRIRPCRWHRRLVGATYNGVLIIVYRKSRDKYSSAVQVKYGIFLVEMNFDALGKSEIGQTKVRQANTLAWNVDPLSRVYP